MAKPKITKIELPGDLNGATIFWDGDEVTIHVIGIDKSEDLVQIFDAARQAGVIGPATVYTGLIVGGRNELAHYIRLASVGGTRFGGRVEQIGPDTFRLLFDELPKFT